MADMATISGGSVNGCQISATDTTGGPKAGGIVGSTSTDEDHSLNITIEGVDFVGSVTLSTGNPYSVSVNGNTYYGNLVGAAVALLSGNGTITISGISDLTGVELIAHAAFDGTITLSQCKTTTVLNWMIQGVDPQIVLEGTEFAGLQVDTQTVKISADESSTIGQLIAGAANGRCDEIEQHFQPTGNSHPTGTIELPAGTTTVGTAFVIPDTTRGDASTTDHRIYKGKITGVEGSIMVVQNTGEGNGYMLAGTYSWDATGETWNPQFQEFTDGDLKWTYDYTDDTLAFDSVDETSVTLSSNGGWSQFSDSAVTVTATDSITEIGDSAFASFSNLQSATFEGTISSVGTGAFSGCSALTYLSFGGDTSVETFENVTFVGCNQLKNVYVGGRVYTVNSDGGLATSGTWNGGDIDSIEDFKAFAELVNSGVDFAGQTINLTNDIAISADDSWVPIGNGHRSDNTVVGNYFAGVFDGGDHTITLYIDYDTPEDQTDDDESGIGLFGCISGPDARIQNLNIVANIVSESNSTGAAVGLMDLGATVYDVEVSGSVTGNEGTGGVVGRILSQGTIDSCINSATVKGNAHNTGGIVGAAYYKDNGMGISNCINSGAVTGTMGVGGIVGLSTGAVRDCTNSGAVSGSGTSVGGVVGEQQNYGSVEGCDNSGAVSNSNTDTNIPDGTKTNSGMGTGGIVGWIRYSGAANTYGDKSTISVINCTNSGTVTSQSTHVGGIVGAVYHSLILTGCVNEASGTVSGSNFTGGIIGGMQTVDELHADSCSLILTNNTTLSKVTGGAQTGMVIGHFASKTDSGNQNCTVLGGSNWTVHGNKVAGTDGTAVDYQVPGIETFFTITKTDKDGNEIEYGYPTLSDAVSDAENGDTIVMMQDCTLISHVIISKDVAIDLGGHTLTIDTSSRFGIIVEKTVSITGGTVIDESNRGSSAAEGRFSILASGSTADLTLSDVHIQTYEPEGDTPGSVIVQIQSGGSVTVGLGAVVEGVASENSDGGNGITAIAVIGPNSGGTSSLEVLDGATISASTYAIAGNGDSDGTTITIDGGTISSDIVAIFHPQEGDISISGGSITGSVGLQYTGAGQVEISGGTITSTDVERTSPFKSPGERDGSILDGAALSIVSRGGEYQSGSDTIEVVITGGSLISLNNSAIADYRIQQQSDGSWAVGEDSGLSTSYLGSLSISADAIVIGGTKKPALWVDELSAGKYSITGGTFSSDVSEYCADGYASGMVDGKWQVATGVIVTADGTQITIATGTSVPADKLPDVDEKTGYMVVWKMGGVIIDPTAYVFQSDTTIRSGYVLDAPTVVVGEDVEIDAGEIATIDVKASHAAGDSITYTYQWYMDGEALSDATSASIEVMEAGEYYAVVTAKDADGLTSSVTSPTITVTVTKAEQDAPATGTGFMVVFGGDMATVTASEKYELSADGETVLTILTLGPGETFQVRLAETDSLDVSEWTANILPVRPDAPVNPSYRVTTSTIVMADDTLVVSLDGRTWAGILSGLSSGTTYNVYVRYASTADSFASESLQMSISTASESEPGPTPMPGDDDSYVTPPVVYVDKDGGSDAVGIIACAAAACAAAIIALFAIFEYRKR